MAICIWRGDAAPVAQETRVTAAAIEVGDQFMLTINGKSISVTATSTSAATLMTALTAAWNNSTIAELSEVTATVDGATLVLRADKPGVPFVVTGSTINGGATDSQSLSISATTVASGPNFWTTPRNWSGNAVPVTGDDIYLVDSTVDILYGLNQAAISPASLNIDQSFTGRIGLRTVNDLGYAEYRDQYLRIAAGKVQIGRGTGSGSSRIKLDTGSTATTINIFDTGSSEDGLASVTWSGNSTGATLNLFRGSLGIALRPGETATLGTLRIAPESSSGRETRVELGPGVTINTIDKCGGILRFAGQSIANLVQHDGSTTIESGDVTALRVRGGTVIYNSTGTLSAATVSASGKLDFSQDVRGKVVTAPIEIFGSAARVSDPFQVIGNLVLDLNETQLPGLDLGTNIRITRTTPPA
jgi:hypothetical protein